MVKIKPVVARTPEALARTLGLSGAESHEWQVQHALVKRPSALARKDPPLLGKSDPPRPLLYRAFRPVQATRRAPRMIMPHPPPTETGDLRARGADDVGPPAPRHVAEPVFGVATLNEQRWVILRERRGPTRGSRSTAVWRSGPCRVRRPSRHRTGSYKDRR